MKILTIDEFKNWEDHAYTLIHVLPKEHYQNLHIKGSINICVYEVSFLAKVKKLNLDSRSKIVLYGESKNELDAKAAASKLHDLGFENIYVLEGGLNACRNILDLEREGNGSDPDQLLNLDNGTYTLVDNSILEWTGENANGKHFGKITLKSGNIEVENSLLNGEFIIDMNSIKTLDLSSEEGADHLDAHLRSDDFFLTKLFPEAKYSFNDLKYVQPPYQTDIN
jgi:rhodanese-related sulfurtransferase